ncbi:hypothetical protein M422DRAFT_276936 [Sphaerobolus stellatus SS14]|uniref:Ubiquitin-like domain-containing protein n=1 Tax=Sphaerobolus stellatus (strain SS14) TaxID=990650 RepID=A0A0C9UAR7_SPHS4|nr:hypothetical protein M422DRAFT_276936 [Sphaerobolus stellatus SS14]
MSSSTSTDATSQISINIEGPSEPKIQISIAADKTVMDLKRAIAEKLDVEADRQRLIFSGKLLKDDDVLSSYKIKSGHTIHMVKGAAHNNVTASTSTPQPLPAMQAGQNASDPLTLLNSYMGHVAMAGVNLSAGLGFNPNGPKMELPRNARLSSIPPLHSRRRSTQRRLLSNMLYLQEDIYECMQASYSL